MRLGFAAVLALCLAIGSPAAAEEEDVFFFASARGGASFPSTTIEAYDIEVGAQDFDTGYEVGFSGGVQLTDWVRWDLLDFSYFSSAEPDEYPSGISGDLVVGYEGSGLSLTTGFRFGDFRRSSRLHPYVSVGIGGSRGKIQLNGDIISQWGMDAKIGAGVEYVLTKHLAVGVRYQFRWLDFEAKFPPTSPPSLQTPAGLTRADVSVEMHTIGLEFVFF